MKKSSDALRTISEVADLLDTPKHVLRFWESKFTQIRPMKRGGGRRYYRPADIELLQGIRHLLYDEGFTIRGVQQIFKREGVDYVKQFASLFSPDQNGEPAPEQPENLTEKKQSNTNINTFKQHKYENVHPKQKVLLSILDEVKACRKILDNA